MPASLNCRRRSFGVVAGVLTVGLVSAPVGAVTLPFVIRTDPGNTEPPFSVGSIQNSFQDYGDNVTSSSEDVGSFIYTYDVSVPAYGPTPDIQIAYSAEPHLHGHSHHGPNVGGAGDDWNDVDYLNDDGDTTDRKFYFTLTPDAAGIGASIKSFELFGYTGVRTHSGTWTVYADTVGGTVLDTDSWSVDGTVTEATPLVVTPSYTNYLGTVVLEINHLVGPGGYLAADDLTFEQVVPEPAALGFILLSGLCLRRRRA